MPPSRRPSASSRWDRNSRKRPCRGSAADQQSPRPGTLFDVRTGVRHLVLALVLACTAAACSGGGGGASSKEPDDALETPTGVAGERAVQATGAGKVRLFGTLAVPPAATSASVPGVLILPGAGAGDRDGSVSLSGVPDRLARDVAKSLSSAGVASYRYDRRGTGESKIEPDVRLSVDDLVADARAGLDLLAQRRETNGKGLSVVAYDSGGLLALRLAALDNRVTRVVLIASPGGTLADVHAAQVAAVAGAEAGVALQTTVAGLLATRSLPPLASLRSELRSMFPAEEAAFLADLYGIDPTVDAAKLKVPVLILVPADRAPYAPERLVAAAPNGAAAVATTAGGPTLSIEGTAVLLNPNDPALHANGMSGPVPGATRDAAALDRITGFVSAAVPR